MSLILTICIVFVVMLAAVVGVGLILAAVLWIVDTLSLYYGIHAGITFAVILVFFGASCVVGYAIHATDPHTKEVAVD